MININYHGELICKPCNLSGPSEDVLREEANMAHLRAIFDMDDFHHHLPPYILNDTIGVLVEHVHHIAPEPDHMARLYDPTTAGMLVARPTIAMVVQPNNLAVVVLVHLVYRKNVLRFH